MRRQENPSAYDQKVHCRVSVPVIPKEHVVKLNCPISCWSRVELPYKNRKHNIKRRDNYRTHTYRPVLVSMDDSTNMNKLQHYGVLLHTVKQASRILHSDFRGLELQAALYHRDHRSETRNSLCQT